MRIAGTKAQRFLVNSVLASVIGGGLVLAGGTMDASAHTWTELRPIGPLPEVREEATAVHDRVSNRLILFGGMGPYCCFKREDIWILNNADGSSSDKSQWTKIIVKPSLTRTNHSAVYNSITNRMIVYGGESNVSGELYDEVWLLKNANGVSGRPQWEQLPVKVGTHPIPRAGHAAVYDGSNNRLIVFGGYFNLGTPWAMRDDTWVLTNADGSEATQSRWIPLAQTGPRPDARAWAFAAYDTKSNQMLIFGGNDFAGTSFNDVWVLHNANGRGAKPSYWVKRSPMGVAPGPRFGLAGGYNGANKEVVIFGGTDDTTTIYNDTWLLINAFGSSPTWVKRTPLGSIPPQLSQMGNVYISAKDKLIVTTGDRAISCCDYINSTFVLRGATN